MNAAQKRTRCYLLILSIGFSIALSRGAESGRVGRRRSEASRSGEAIHQILVQIEAVNLQVNQIATAAEQQTGTTNEISGKMLQITDVIQATANGARDSASGATSLAKFADDLQLLVRQFKLAA